MSAAHSGSLRARRGRGHTDQIAARELIPMRYGLIAALAAFAVLFASAAKSDDAPKDVKGIYLMSDFPAVTVRPGETSTINLRLHNYDMTPERLALSVSGVPAGWTATLMGGGQPVAAAMPATNSSVSLELRLDVPKNAATGTQTLTVAASNGSTNVELPIAVTLAKDLPAKLTLTPQLPELRGTSKSSFEYQLGIKNDSGKKLIVSLSAQAPQNFDASFTENYGSQELNAVPVDAGQTKDVKLKVRPPTAATKSWRGSAPRMLPRRPISSSTSAVSRSSISAVAKVWSPPVLPPAKRRRCRSSSPTAALHRRMTSSSAVRRRTDGRSRSIQSPWSASRRTRTRKCRR